MELRFTTEKTWQITKKYETLIHNGKSNGNISKQLKFLNKHNALKLRLTMEKLWNYGKKL